MDTSALSISPAELAALLGRPDAPLLLDVRRTARFADSQALLPGAQRCAPEDIPRLAAQQAPRDVIVYCVYGHVARRLLRGQAGDVFGCAALRAGQQRGAIGKARRPPHIQQQGRIGPAQQGGEFRGRNGKGRGVHGKLQGASCQRLDGTPSISKDPGG